MTDQMTPEQLFTAIERVLDERDICGAEFLAQTIVETILGVTPANTAANQHLARHQALGIAAPKS